MDCFLGIDIGTSSTKSLIMRADGSIASSAQVKYDVLRPKAGFAEQDIETLWKAVRDTLVSLTTAHPHEAEQIKSIGFSGQMHGLVLVDSEGKALRNAIIWEDQRSIREVEQIYAAIPEEQFCAKTLNTLSTGFLISSLIWVRNNEPELFSRISYVLMIKDYIRYRMCGEIACDTSDASSSSAFDTTKRDWAWTIIERLGLPCDIFPKCHEAHETAGVLNARIAEETGLPPGIPMVYGGGDTLMHEVGTCTIDETKPWVANIGTSCQVSCAISAPIHDAQYRTNTFCHVKKDLWMLMSANLCGGAAIKWLSDMVFRGMRIDDMNAMAARVPVGSDGLIFLPYLSGARSPDNDPHARAMFMGLMLKHGQEHLVRATMEGVVYSLKNAYILLQSITGKTPDRIVASGGGARSELLLQMQADAMDRPVYTTVEAEQSCIGAAITAAVGIGFYCSFAEGCESAVRFNQRVIEPIRRNVRIYANYFEIYRQLYERNRELFVMYKAIKGDLCVAE